MGSLATSVGRHNTIAAVAGTVATIAEGGSIALDASGSAGATSYAWDLDNDGDYDDATGVSPSVPWATLASLGVGDDGVLPIGLAVDGGLDADTTSVTITNVDPTLATTGSTTATDGGVYTLNLAATDPGADTITSWTINWGDGTIDTIAGNPSTVTHTYTGQGFTYGILASATDEDGTYLQNELLVPSFTGDQVFRFAPTTGAFLQRWATGTNPIETLIGPDGRLYVSADTTSDVRRYNAQTGAFIDDFVASGAGGINGAEGIAFGPDGHLYVSDWTADDVRRYDGTTGAHIGVFATGSGGTYELVFGPDHNLYVTRFTDNEVARYDGTTGAFIDTFVAAGTGGLDSPEQVAFGPDGNLYVGGIDSGDVLRFDGTTGALLGTFIASGGPGDLDRPTGLAFGPDGNLYVADYHDHAVLRYDGTTGAFIDTYVAPGAGGLTGPAMMTFLPELQVTVVP